MSQSLFANELADRFRQFMQNLAEQCLQGLQKQVQTMLPNSPSNWTIACQRALNKIPFWKQDAYIDEAEYAQKRFPNIIKYYKYTIYRYLQLAFIELQNDSLTIQLPSFIDFLISFYFKLSKEPCIQNMSYFHQGILERKTVIEELLRTVFSTMLERGLIKQQSKCKSENVLTNYPRKFDLCEDDLRSLINNEYKDEEEEEEEEDEEEWESISQVNSPQEEKEPPKLPKLSSPRLQQLPQLPPPPSHQPQDSPKKSKFESGKVRIDLSKLKVPTKHPNYNGVGGSEISSQDSLSQVPKNKKVRFQNNIQQVEIRDDESVAFF